MDKECVPWTLLPPEVRRLGGARVWGGKGNEIWGEVTLLLLVLLSLLYNPIRSQK